MGNTILTEKISYKAGRNSTAGAWGCVLQGCSWTLLRRTVASTGGTLHRNPHTHHQTLSILSRLRHMRQKAAVAAASHVPLWHRAGAARPLLGVSGRLSRSSRSSHPLVCPVCRSLGRCGGAPAGSTRASQQRANEGQVLPRSMGCPPCRSASARKSERSHTRASFLSPSREEWKRGRTVRTPRVSTGGALRGQTRPKGKAFDGRHSAAHS